ncbi:MAG TPA: chemotaxis protein CheW [Sphingomicrobium sp.]|nr:chemotaxis protein CheW [Sphingomicrobium sp.]
MRKIKRADPANQQSRTLTIAVAGERLAIPANDVLEVIRSPAVTRVPHSPAGLLGVANLRGKIIPIVSLAALLGKASAAPSSRRVVVVGQDQPVGLTVDEALALERSETLSTAKEPVRLIDVSALIASRFGAMEKPALAASLELNAGQHKDHDQAAPTESFFSFEIAGQLFALPLAHVHEVLAVPASIAVVPRTDDAMIGAVTLRNRLLPLASLSILLGLGPVKAVGSARIVVAAIGAVRVGLVVDGLKAIVRASADQIDPVPLVLTRGREEAHIQAICRLDEGRRLMSILSTDHLLEDSLAERLAVQSDQEEKPMMDGAADGKSEQFVLFQLGEEHYGLPIACVSEVVAPPEKLTKLPKAPKFIDGVMNLRGQIVPVIDLRRRFEAAASGSGAKRRIIVVRLGTSLAGFIVDSVSEVLRASREELRAAPELTSRQSKVIERIANLERDGRMILLVDPQELLDRAEQDLIAAMHGTASASS